MKYAFVILILIVGRSPVAIAQDSSQVTSSYERAALVTGASLAFSLADYVGFNLVRQPAGAPVWYRAGQIALQAGLTYFLYRYCGLPSAVSFGLIEWTWGNDLGYSGWAYAINPAAVPGVKWENRTLNPMRGNQITWAGWTPLGLMRPRGTVIDRSLLYWQSAIGYALSMAILW